MTDCGFEQEKLIATPEPWSPPSIYSQSSRGLAGLATWMKPRRAGNDIPEATEQNTELL